MLLYIAKTLKRKGRDKRGFTLVELLAVLALLAIIAAIAVPRFNATIAAAKEKADRATAQLIARAAEQKWMDDGGNESKDYTGKDLADNGYLREKPEPQSTDTYDDFKARVDEDGICYEVIYTSNSRDDNNNLLRADNTKTY
ncbi:MAG: prepilin-type N-terminal cleavage/methylation domain-containing protein [Clostridia bacterium]|jgi:type IV pilus assembly protein PilA